MFTVRVNIASIRASHVAIRCFSGVNNRLDSLKKCIIVDSERLIVDKRIFNRNITRQAFDFNSSIRSNSLFSIDPLQTLQSKCTRGCSTDAMSKADTFGDLGSRNFEKVELDKDEEAEEKFVENEARVFREHRLTPGGYANLIKKHINSRNYDAAADVLKLIKNNRDQPTAYMYNLLLRAYATSGDFKKSRSLYVTMKKRGLPCNGATYTSILNACANYHHSPTALEYVTELRDEFIQKNVVLNETHYNAMIKVYGRHNKLHEALKLADEMRDKQLSTSDITFNSLLFGAISDRQAGLRHALAIWHMMKRHRIKPNIKTYNLMLRAIRDTKLGELKVNDLVISSEPELPIVIIEGRRPDLLGTPPSVSSIIMTIKEKPEVAKDDTKKIAGNADKTTKIAQLESEAAYKNRAIAADSQSENLPATIETDSEENNLIAVEKRLEQFPLEKTHRQNRLILFGGVSGILERMARDRVEPDTKTITILMELSPQSDAAEKNIMQIARNRGISLDIDFYNMVMKKKTLRRNYAGAKQILDDIQRNGLCPDIITWGILAMGCENSEDARTLIDGMHLTGHRLNPVIAGTLINVACKKIRFGFVLEIMEIMARQKIKPTWETYTALDGFQTEMRQMIASKKFSRTVNNPAFKTGFSKFNLRYSSWQLDMGRKPDAKKPKKT